MDGTGTSKILPCPFCGQVPEVRPQNFWTGMSNRVIAYKIQHHCYGSPGHWYIEYSAATQEELEEKWNHRT